MSRTNLPLVSVVTPSRNQVAFLETTLNSVLGQEYPNLEYIVIDGGSTDGSVDLIREYQERLSFWVSESDRGQAAAINKGLRKAKGEIVAWLNSDDVYLPGAIREAVATLEANPEVGMVYADGLMVDAQLRLLDPHRYRQLSALDLLCFEVLLQPTVFLRRAVFEELGYLNESYHLILDHELWVRIASRFPILHVEKFWALERTHGGAKTIGQAGAFVEEAEQLVTWAGKDERLAELMTREQRRIRAGLDVFAARRLIDAGEYQTAVRKLARALASHPPTVARYWYKVVQAVFSALGLSWLFTRYRDIRRGLLYKYQTVQLPYSKRAKQPGNESGPLWPRPEAD